MQTRLAISIINYRTADLTIAAVRSALVALVDYDGVVVVVDNASGDGSADEIEKWMNAENDPRVRLVRSATNSGFSGGHNQGMMAVPDADFFMILNSDAVLHPESIAPMLKAADENPKAGFFAPKLEWDDGTPQISCFRFASPTSELIRGAETGPVTKLFKHRTTSLPLPPDPDKIEWMSGACLMFRASMVDEVGPMDEGYFLYFEDAEYSLRARRKGWGMCYVPQARAIHFRGGSGPVKTMQKEKGRLPSYFWRSRSRFLRQAHGPLGPLAGNLAWIMGRGIANVRLLLGRSVPKAHKNEWRDIWLGFFAPLRPDMKPRT